TSNDQDQVALDAGPDCFGERSRGAPAVFVEVLPARLHPAPALGSAGPPPVFPDRLSGTGGDDSRVGRAPRGPGAAARPRPLDAPAGRPSAPGGERRRGATDPGH